MLRRKTHIILDTNALMLPGKGVDIFTLLEQALSEPHTLCTYKGVLEELQQIMEGTSKDAFNAKLGYILTKQKALKMLPSSPNKHVDDVIVENATAKGSIIVTQDKQLIRRLREKGVRVLRYQQHHYAFQ